MNNDEIIWFIDAINDRLWDSRIEREQRSNWTTRDMTVMIQDSIRGIYMTNHPREITERAIDIAIYAMTIAMRYRDSDTGFKTFDDVKKEVSGEMKEATAIDTEYRQERAKYYMDLGLTREEAHSLALSDVLRKIERESRRSVDDGEEDNG